MQNRKERREMERKYGLLRAEKTMTKEERDEVRQRKHDYVKEMLLMKAQEEENRRINQEAEDWAKQLESFMATGMSKEQAESILTNNRELIKKREEKIAAKKARQKS